MTTLPRSVDTQGFAVVNGASVAAFPSNAILRRTPEGIYVTLNGTTRTFAADSTTTPTTYYWSPPLNGSAPSRNTLDCGSGTTTKNSTARQILDDQCGTSSTSGNVTGFTFSNEGSPGMTTTFTMPAGTTTATVTITTTGSNGTSTYNWTFNGNPGQSFSYGTTDGNAFSSATTSVNAGSSSSGALLGSGTWHGR